MAAVPHLLPWLAAYRRGEPYNPDNIWVAASQQWRR
jgi:hypothetical protein